MADYIAPLRFVSGSDTYTVADPRVTGGSEAASAELPPAHGLLLALLAQASVRPVTILAYGSSTTLGGGASDYATTAWCPILLDYLQQRYPRADGQPESAMVVYDSTLTPITDPGIHLVRDGASGRRAIPNYGVSTQMNKVGAVINITMIGSNDMLDGAPLATYKAEIEEGLDFVEANVTNRPHVNVLVHQQGRLAFTPEQWAAYGQVLREIAAERPDTTIMLDTSGYFDPLRSAGDTSYTNDNVHPSDRGHRILAHAILTGMLGWPQPQHTRST